jgi:ADP-ribosylglycohydrolase
MEELCGALIRADAFGYACPGHPALAAELAWRDASFSHRRTGIYGEMFAAAAIATAFVADEPMAIFRTALQYVPQRSRFARVVRDCLEIVQGARDWLEAYERIHGRYLEHGSCRIYQEIGTVMNALHFAGDVGEGICMQVAQGNDTDSFGCTCGSILGAFHGPEGLDGRWLAPFNDTIHTTVATLHEMRVSALAARMGRLPARVQGPGFRV